MPFERQDGSLGYGEELALFERPVIDGGVQKVRWIEYKPVNQITSGGAIEFLVSGNGNHYIDLRRTRLNIKVKVLQGDGTDLPSDEVPILSTGESGEVDVKAKVSPVNLFMHSLFAQVDVYLQQKLVTSSNTNYFLKAYLDTLLSCKQAGGHENLQAQLFYKDSGGNMDDSDPFAATNTGLVLRQRFISQSKTVDMEAPLKSDIFAIDRYLLNGVELRIVLTPSPPALHLMARGDGASYKTVIEDATLKVCHVTPTPQMLTAHQETLNKKHFALYPYIKSELKRFTVSQGAFDFTKDDVFQHMLPVRLVICVVNNEALSGSYRRNPFNFHHYNVSHVEVSVDGESVPGRAFQPVFKPSAFHGNYVDAYLAMACGLTSGKFSGVEEKSVDRSDFARGYAIYVFDLEPDIVLTEDDGEEFWPFLKSGNLRVDMHFSVALPETVSIIVYGTFPRLLKIDNTRAVILE